MDVQSITVLENQVKDLLYRKGYSEINIQFGPGATKADGIIGKICYVKILAMKDKDHQKLDVVIKSAPVDKTHRKMIMVRNLFLREILFYNVVAPIYGLQDELKVPLEMRYYIPKCYGTSNKFRQEIVILEDLNKRGFEVARLHTLDYDHAVIIFQTIARFHALSFIYEERYPERFKQIVNQCFAVGLCNEEFDDTYSITYGDKVVKQFGNAITDVALRKRCEVAVGTNAWKKHDDLTRMKGGICVLLHGDNWLNNHMFKYEDDKPTEGIPIDYQWSRYGSIAYDFMYLFSLSVCKDLRRNQFWQLVDEYYAAFKGFLSFCGYDANKYCTYEQFKGELKVQGVLSLLVFMIAAPIFKFPELTIPELYASTKAYEVTEEYRQNVNDMVTDWANFGFI